MLSLKTTGTCPCRQQGHPSCCPNRPSPSISAPQTPLSCTHTARRRSNSGTRMNCAYPPSMSKPPPPLPYNSSRLTLSTLVSSPGILPFSSRPTCPYPPTAFRAHRRVPPLSSFPILILVILRTQPRLRDLPGNSDLPWGPGRTVKCVVCASRATICTSTKCCWYPGLLH